ncbi:hypothetical protein DFH09DRAFT_1332635 [Mycena vulgaris]|nr:hypothetical protein DFH09DRAFT_1332635 [Mycena vulgaris]
MRITSCLQVPVQLKCIHTKIPALANTCPDSKCLRSQMRIHALALDRHLESRSQGLLDSPRAQVQFRSPFSAHSQIHHISNLHAPPRLHRIYPRRRPLPPSRHPRVTRPYPPALLPSFLLLSLLLTYPTLIPLSLPLILVCILPSTSPRSAVHASRNAHPAPNASPQSPPRTGPRVPAPIAVTRRVSLFRHQRHSLARHALPLSLPHPAGYSVPSRPVVVEGDARVMYRQIDIPRPAPADPDAAPRPFAAGARVVERSQIDDAHLESTVQIPRSQVRGLNTRARKFVPALLNSPRSQTQVPADAHRL